MNEQRRITADNFHLNTWATFKPFDSRKAMKLLDALFSLRRKRKPELKNAKTIEVDGEVWEILHTSQNHNYYFRSRSFSYYFRKKRSRSVVRVSDHWSSSQYTRSRKLNCGAIRSCRWDVPQGEAFHHHVPNESYDSRFIAGTCSFSAFEAF